MRFSENWLRDFIPSDWSSENLVHQLTMAGLEVDRCEPVAGAFTGVVVAEILSAEAHPKADRLKVCQVSAGQEPLQIVCGAPNARPGIRVPLAKVGAELPGGLRIAAQPLRGIDSLGMLCSAKELGLEEAASGLLELPDEAPVGEDLRSYLDLNDRVIEVDLTPNRADCLSVEGIAREVALINRVDFRPLNTVVSAPDLQDQRGVKIEAATDCPRYLGQLLVGVDRSRPTPLWIRERLRRSGIRPLDLVVDVTNYVLLELGQPLHAFDADQLQGLIRVRRARAGETLTLLNGQTVSLQPDTLVIADDRGPQALAGIMGGRDSSVSDQTRTIFLESAFFDPLIIQGKARRYGLNTDASHRFERGVSPSLTARALHRTVSLILTYGGGRVGPVVEVSDPAALPQGGEVWLSAEKLTACLGLELPVDTVERILLGLGMTVISEPSGWRVTAPEARFDIRLAEDLIEEIARIHGYDQLPAIPPQLSARMQPAPETRLTLDRAKDLLVDRGYQEVLTYSFTPLESQRRIEPERDPLALLNPLSAELAVMRTSLWPGLLDIALRNRHRQQSRIRLFESGLCFLSSNSGLEQAMQLAFLALGPRLPEQWDVKADAVDFFDLRSDLEALIRLTGRQVGLRVVSGPHPALHPGQSAEIWLDDVWIGRLGMLHPKIEAEMGFDQPVFLASLALDPLLDRELPRFREVSRFPSVRRDMAVLVPESLPVSALLAVIQAHAGASLKEVVIFDVYQGAGLDPGQKSIALGLIWQEASETLVDEQIDDWFKSVVEALGRNCEARLRN